MKRDYWLYTPETIDKEQTYWLVVGVHGFRGAGKGAAGLAGWANKMDNVIVIGPTFPSTGPYYQMLQGNTGKQLIDLFKKLYKEFKLHKKMFIYGFSGGSQFSHRFAQQYPSLIIGLSSHSGGTWDSAPSKNSSSFLWTISCGLKDTATSIGANKPRIDYFRLFNQNMIKTKAYACKPFVTNQGHGRAREVYENTQECFRVATTGLFDYQRQETEGMSIKDRDKWLRNDKKSYSYQTFEDGVNKIKIKANPDGWTYGKKALSVMKSTRKILDKMNKTKLK